MTQLVTTRSSARTYEARGRRATLTGASIRATQVCEPVPNGNKHRLFQAGSIERLFANTLATFVLVLTAGLCFLSLLPTLVGYESVVVSSPSMEPALHTADVVVTGSPESNNVQVGTVIDFRTTQGKRIHRVVELTENGYRTKGDANTSPDPQLVTETAVEGIGLLVVPLIGLPRFWISEGAWLNVIGASAALLASLVVAGLGWGERTQPTPSATTTHWSRRSLT